MNLSNNNLNNSIFNTKNGRYVIGGTTEVSSFAIESWDATQLPPDESDIVYFVEKKYENKPHILGLVFYGDTGLWWVICQYNGIIDPIDEIVEGRLLLIPTKNRVTALLGANSVIQSTRLNIR